MGWVHRTRRRGALLALAAVALQIAVSFAHVHLHGIGATAPQAALAGAHKVAAVQASRQGPAQNPRADDDYCAICASIFLVSASFVSEPPKLPVPDGFERIGLRFSVAGAILSPRRVYFQSRAPPAA